MATYKYADNGTSLKVTDRPVYGSSRLGSYTRQIELVGELAMHQWPYVQPMQAPLKRYELTDHLGNVNTVVTGRLLPMIGSGIQYQAEVVSAQTHEAFGSLLPGRNYSSDSYRFGFNGMEKDDAVYGSTGNSYTTEFRQYDTRVARWFSLDPLTQKYPWQSPYVAFNNNPILYKDPTGAEGDPPEPRKNTLNAPEISAASQKNATYPIDAGTAASAFNRKDDDPLKGYIKSGEDYNKVFFDKDFNMNGRKGAYFAERPIKIPVGYASYDSQIQLDYNPDGSLADASTNSFLSEVSKGVDKLNNLAPPMRDAYHVIDVTVYSSEKISTKPALERASARILQDAAQKAFPGVNVFISSKLVVGTKPVPGDEILFNGLIGSEGNVMHSETLKINTYGF